MTTDRALPGVVPVADGRPMTEEVIALLRARVCTGFYDRPEVIEAVARSIAIRADAAG